MSDSDLKPKLPGYIATGLLIVSTSLWVLWGTVEMYYQGWGSPLPPPWLYLIPALISLSLALFALTWPRTGGWLMIVIGAMFSLWWMIMAVSSGRLSFSWFITAFPVTSLLVITGVFLLFEARYRNRLRGLGIRPVGNWFWRNWPYVLMTGVPALVFMLVSAFYLPQVLTRLDDGDRGARLIQGNGVSLVWAPQGPGWNWKQPDGTLPSWLQIALYALPPLGFEPKEGYQAVYPTYTEMVTTGLCSYLSGDGTELLDQVQNIWRLPTVDEIVRSLVKHGENAGCTWDGQAGKANCELAPDKETPLWAPDASPIYYWAADEFDQANAWYVSYNGSVHFQPKDWGNSRQGYRCVRFP
jgi:hypothetical protein